MIYLDNAATAKKRPQCVVDAVADAMQSLGNSARGAHEGSLDASRTIYGAREKIAALFGFDAPERVCFTANSTEALNIALCGLFSPGDHIISTDTEHNSVLRPLYRLQSEGVELSFLPADRQGKIDYADFPRLLQRNTRAIVCNHASNLTGNTLDLEQIGSFAAANHLLLIVDASQSAGVLPIDMKKMHVDVLCFTGHKGLLGPQGTGGLCAAEGVQIRPWKVGGTGVQTALRQQPCEYPVRLEAGTLNAHGIAGLSAALDYLKKEGQSALFAQKDALARYFAEAVMSIGGVRLYGDHTQHLRVPIVTLNLDGYDAAALADALNTQFGIAVRAGLHCAPRLHRALGTEKTGSVRFSFGWENTKEDADAAIFALRRLAEP